MMSEHERLSNIARARKLSVAISHGQELRVRAYMDRANKKLDAADRYNLDSDDDLLIALDVLLQLGLECDEAGYGLRGTDWGELLSEDVAAAMVAEYMREREDRDV